MRHIEARAASSEFYDVVIVGAGVAGSIVAKQLAARGYKILLMEAGQSRDLTIKGFQSSLDHFYRQVSKDNNAPYRRNPNADSPKATDVRRYEPGGENAIGYFVHNGPVATDSTYIRVAGGSTMHWRACTPRMVPDDFQMQTLFGQGRDWPITYDDIEPYYRMAELEMGVSGDVATQDFHGMSFPEDYVYPMEAIPVSYLDRVVSEGLSGMQVEDAGETFPLKVRPTPQARNGVPNAKFAGGKGFEPAQVTSQHQWVFGQRCQGNANCIPICPVQAKYDARRSLFSIPSRDHVDFVSQTVASRVELDPVTARVTSIHFKAYRDADSPEHTEGHVRGRLFVLATNAIENAKLMLASKLTGSSGLVGKNLMDHAYACSWALLPEPAGSMRGPPIDVGLRRSEKRQVSTIQGCLQAGNREFWLELGDRLAFHRPARVRGHQGPVWRAPQSGDERAGIPSAPLYLHDGTTGRRIEPGLRRRPLQRSTWQLSTCPHIQHL
jgi:choline dehydrogenase-like flavoprotein